MVHHEPRRPPTPLSSDGGDISSYNDVDDKLYASDSTDDYDGLMTFTLVYLEPGKVPTSFVYR